MKRIRINKLTMAAGLAAALALSASFPASSQVPEKSSAKGGASLLLKPSGTVSASNYQPMACGTCKDVFVAVRDNEVRGGGAKSLVAPGAPAKLVATHACQGCGVEWKTVGHGKTKLDVATHKCTACGAESLACCNTSRASTVATKGMEKTFEIAPLK